MLIAGIAVLLVGMRSGQRALIAADKLLHASEHWSDAIMPIVLFALFGLVFGVVLGWRIAAAASLNDVATWLVACVCILALAGAGGVAAGAIFPAVVPSTCWIGLACMGGAGVAGTYVILAWLG